MIKKIGILALAFCLFPKTTMSMDFNKKILTLAAAGIGIYTGVKLIQSALFKMTLNDPESLHRACNILGDEKTVERLLQAGALVDQPDAEGRTPLHYAAFCGRAKIVELLLQHHAFIDAQDNNGETPLHKAITWNCLDVIRCLLKYHARTDIGDHLGYKPLHEALRIGDRQTFELLLEHGASLEDKNNGGNTPLCQAVIHNSLSQVEILLKRGAIVNPQDGVTTPLHLAACGGKRAMTQLLLRYGANLAARNDDGSTPLHSAVTHEHTLAKTPPDVCQVSRDLLCGYFFPPCWKTPQETLVQRTPPSLQALVHTQFFKHIERYNDQDLIDNFPQMDVGVYAVIADQAPLRFQQIASAVWKTKMILGTTEDQKTVGKKVLEHLLMAHRERHLQCIQYLLAIKNDKEEMAEDLARLNNYDEAAQLFAAICQAKTFSDLDGELQNLIDQTIRAKLAL